MMKLLNELSKPGCGMFDIPFPEDLDEVEFTNDFLREEDLKLPEVSEPEVVRHFTNLSRMNVGIDTAFYPLGSCTMKYNPRGNERAVSLPGISGAHPMMPDELCQGYLGLILSLSEALARICGMAEVSLAPAAGAHGEWVGMKIIRAWHNARGEGERTRLIVPDSSHGTNPASAARVGFDVITIPSTTSGFVDREVLKKVCDEGKIVGLMLTNPNTLGLFDPGVHEIAEIVHAAGGLLYYDGANLNALAGLETPGGMGFDIVHVNLHKTFSTPHGGGGPGSGPVGVKESLRDFLPTPRLKRQDDGKLSWQWDEQGKSIGHIISFYGNTLTYLRALAYLYRVGEARIGEVSAQAILNANVLMKLISSYLLPAFPQACGHEFVISLEELKKRTGVKALDAAKRLMDFGYHPPTMYFPSLVHECLMIEPTESESLEQLKDFARDLETVLKEAESNPEKLHQAPYTTPVKRVDEVKAAKELKLTWF